MKTIKNYFLTFVVLTLFSCGSVLKITENESKEEQRPILSEKEIKFYDGSDCGYFNNYLTCYNQVFSNGNFTGYSITNNGGWQSIGLSEQPLDIYTDQMAGVGIVNFISISKLNPNLIFTGSLVNAKLCFVFFNC